jgi:hypothetical protein
MTEKSWDTLYEKYPDLFANIDNKHSCMAFGIECNMGWYDIISSICYRIQRYEKNKKYRTELNQKKDPLYISDYYYVAFDQIKEKYGGLRIYFTGGDEYIQGVIDMAEEISYKICERCGCPGSPNKQGWIMTLCDNCRGKNG